MDRAVIADEDAGVPPEIEDLSGRIVVALVAIVCFLFLLVIALYGDYWKLIAHASDNNNYLAAVRAIRTGHFAGTPVNQFWGVSYASVPFSVLTPLNDRGALLAVSMVSAGVAIWLTVRLWGTWPAAAFVATGWEWWQRSLLGGSEPLFLALLFGAFLAARKKWWIMAFLLAALSAVVRLPGVFGVVAVAAGAASEKRWRDIGIGTLISLGVGTAYCVPFQLAFGDPLANIHWYTSSAVGSSPSWPILPIVREALRPAPMTNRIKVVVWVAGLVVATVVALAQPQFRRYLKNRVSESVFLGIYALFLLTYRGPGAWTAIPRFSLPLVPVVAYGVRLRFHKRSTALLFAVAAVVAVLSALSAIGIRNVV
jgi:hypothetical protein